MLPQHQIRADYDASSIVVYQAYPQAIAAASLKAGRFVEPFSFNRMTWIKPSFLWLMHRSNWGQKSGQECILAVRISRIGWERALASGVLTSYEPKAHASQTQWADAFAKAPVQIQWDPERNLRGAALQHGSVQVGIGRQMIHEYNESWLMELRDLTPTVAKMRDLLRRGEAQAASRHLPHEKPYPVNDGFGRHLLIT